MTEKIDSFNGRYRFLSNFYASPIERDGLVYRTVEHAFQAGKTLNQNVRQHIANMPHPGDAKRAGRKVRLRPDWESIKFDVMHELLRKKFAPSTPLSTLLLNTNDAELIEGNTRSDRVWGVCGGTGDNHLGRLLMLIRDELRNSQTTSVDVGTASINGVQIGTVRLDQTSIQMGRDRGRCG